MHVTETVGAMVDERERSEERAVDSCPAAVARFDRVGQCTIGPCVVNRVAPSIARRFYSAKLVVVAKLLSDPVVARPTFNIKPRILPAKLVVDRLLPVSLVDVDRQFAPISLEVAPIRFRQLTPIELAATPSHRARDRRFS